MKSIIGVITLMMLTFGALESPADPIRASRASKILSLGVCELVEANNSRLNPNFGSKAVINPTFTVDSYLREKEFYSGEFEATSVKLSQKPLHGEIRFTGNSIDNVKDVFDYAPHKNYVGKDEFSYELLVNGRQVLVNYYIHVIDYPKYEAAYNYTNFDPYKLECGKYGIDGKPWKVLFFSTVHRPQSI